MARRQDAPAQDAFTADLGPGRFSAETSYRWRQAGERRDLELARSLLTPDMVLRMPATDQWAWHGVDDVVDLLAIVFGTLERIEFQDDVGDEHVRALRLFGRVSGVDFEEVHFLWFDERHRVKEAAFFVRPGVGLAAMTASFGPQILEANSSRALGRFAHHFLRTATKVIDVVDRRVIPYGAPNPHPGNQAPVTTHGVER